MELAIPGVVHGPMLSIVPGSMLDIQNLRHCLRFTESESAFLTKSSEEMF